MIVTAPGEDEYVQDAPAGRFRHVTETLLAEAGRVTGNVAVDPCATVTVDDVKTGAPPPLAESTSNWNVFEVLAEALTTETVYTPAVAITAAGTWAIN